MLAEHNAALKQIRPDAQEAIIEDAGNWLAWEVPARFIEEVERFLVER
jgi:hypothetical protein